MPCAAGSHAITHKHPYELMATEIPTPRVYMVTMHGVRRFSSVVGAACRLGGVNAYHHTYYYHCYRYLMYLAAWTCDSSGCDV